MARILIVEDDCSIREILHMHLELLRREQMLKSTIPEYPNPIDSRCLQFELSYYMLGKEQIDNLMISFYTWCQSFMNNQCVAEWFWGRRKITSSSIPFRISQNTAYTFGMDANVVSNVVYDRKTYKENKQKLLADASTTRKELDCSKDYYTFFESQFFDIPESPSAWKETLLRFFNEKGRFCLSSVTSTKSGVKFTQAKWAGSYCKKVTFVVLFY